MYVGLGIERQHLDRRVGVQPHLVIEIDDVIAGLVRAPPPVPAGPDRTVLFPRQGEVRRPTYASTQIGPLHAHKMLDQPKDVRTAACQRTSSVVVLELVDG